MITHLCHHLTLQKLPVEASHFPQHLSFAFRSHLRYCIFLVLNNVRYSSIFTAIEFPDIIHRIDRTIVRQKNHRILFPSNVPISNKIPKSSVSNPTTILSIVENNIFPQIKKSKRRYLSTPLIDTVKKIMMHRYIPHCPHFKISYQNSLIFQQLLNRIRKSKDIVANSHI